MGGPAGPDARRPPSVGSSKGWPFLVRRYPSRTMRSTVFWRNCSRASCVVEEPLQVLVGEEPAAHEGLEDRVVEGLQVVLVPLARLEAEAALEEEVGELAHQVLEVEVVPEARRRTCGSG